MYAKNVSPNIRKRYLKNQNMDHGLPSEMPIQGTQQSEWMKASKEVQVESENCFWEEVQVFGPP